LAGTGHVAMQVLDRRDVDHSRQTRHDTNPSSPASLACATNAPKGFTIFTAIYSFPREYFCQQHQ
jgi:hypothetical protein